jgi:tetratricopeptide (TPR) repeat protein
MWRATRLPRRLREIVALRLSALPDEQRSLLDVAAVDGVAFDGDAIAAAIDRSLLDVLRVLQNVYRNTELILPSEDGWRFANATFQEGIYEDLASDLRRVLHRRLAEHLEARGESVDPERLGVHWERAGESERAAPYLNRAALLAALRQEHLRAIDLATRSGLFPDGIRPESACDQAELVFTMAGGLSDMGRTQDAAALVERMLDAATAVGEEQLLLRSVVWREDIRLHSEAGASVDLAELRRAAESLADSLELGRARYLLGTIADRRGDLDEAERWMKLAIEIFGRCGPAWMHSSSLDKLAQIAAHRGRNLEAEALYADAARIAEHSGRRLSAAVSHVNRVLSAFDRGESKELEPQLGNAVRTFRLSGMDAHAGQTLVHLARIRYDHGDLRGAESALEEALAILEGADRPLVLSFAFREKAYLDATRGRLREANEHLRTARSLAESAGAEFAMVKTACVKTHCLCFAGDREEAANRAQTALRLSGEMTRRTLADWLAEASVYGLPASALRECMAQQPPRDESTLAGAIALAEDSGDADALRTAASAFRDPAIGERRALMHAVADLFLAEALRREGDEKAQDRAEAALQGAERVGHVWLQATALRLLSRLSPESDFASRLRAHVAAVAKTAGDERISSVWAP